MYPEQFRYMGIIIAINVIIFRITIITCIIIIIIIILSPSY